MGGNSFKAVLQNSLHKKKPSTILGINYGTAPKPCELSLAVPSISEGTRQQGIAEQQGL